MSPVPIWKVLLVDGESKVINHLTCEEYELTNISWSKLQKKYHVSRNKIYTAIKEKEDLEVPNTDKKGQTEKPVKHEATISTPS